MNPSETGASLLAKLAARPRAAWDLVYVPEVGAIHVWPTLRAAAKQRDNFTVARINPFKDKTLAECAAMNPMDPRWDKMLNKVKDRYIRHELGCRRDPYAWNITPTMQKGGVELPLATLKDLEISPLMRFLVPLGMGVKKTDTEEVNRIIRELFVGIYVCHEVPSLAMDPMADKSAYVSLPAPYQGTLVGDVLKEVDAIGKGIIHRKRLLRDNPECSAKMDEASRDLRALESQVRCEAMNFTFVPRQKSIKQVGDVVLLDSELVVRGGYKIQDIDDALRARFQAAFEKSADGVGEVLEAIPEAERPLRLLKIIGFMTQLLVTLKAEGLMPDLHAMPCAPIVYEPEDALRPFLKPSARDSTWYPHGGAKIDFTSVPKGEVSSDVQGIMANAKADDKVTIGGATTMPREYLTVQMPIVKFDLAGREPKWFVDKLSSFAAHATLEESEWLQEEERLGRGSMELLKIAAVSDMPGQL